MSSTKRRHQEHPWRRQISIGLSLLLAVIALIAVHSAGNLAASDVNVLANNSFEQGFSHRVGCGTVAAYWECFTNGGIANFGFYDDQWDPVVADGEHSQLIEINTKDYAAADHNRIAGIYQTVPVVPYGVYTLNLKGMIRTTEMEGDPWRYRVEVGWVHGVSRDWYQVADWIDVGWDTYHERTEPGAFDQFEIPIHPHDQHLTIFIRVLKKWGVPQMELGVNLDTIALTGPSPYVAHPAGQFTPTEIHKSDPPEGQTLEHLPVAGDMPSSPAACIHVVKPGDALGRIAALYGVSVQSMAQANSIRNPDYIFVGQVLNLPSCVKQAQTAKPEPRPAPTTVTPTTLVQPQAPVLRYVVKAGDTLSIIARYYNVSVHDLAQANGIVNINAIYVGQLLVIPHP